MPPSTKGLAVCHGTQVSSSTVADDEPTLKRLAGISVFRYPCVVDVDHRAATTELTDDVVPTYTRCLGVCVTDLNFKSRAGHF